ncbi:hypothetical protein F4808DRAFT_365691 [Astrocystis sublimbata]|nr:hypothetical protein F4808DRAFT_365691 [Astrocystis sublimbata]
MWRAARAARSSLDMEADMFRPHWSCTIRMTAALVRRVTAGSASSRYTYSSVPGLENIRLLLFLLYALPVCAYALPSLLWEKPQQAAGTDNQTHRGGGGGAIIALLSSCSVASFSFHLYYSTPSV